MDLETMAAAITPAAIDELTRTTAQPVPAEPDRHEVGWTTSVRQTALRLVDVIGCTTWTAETVEPVYPVRYAEQRYQEIYNLDRGRFRIVVTSVRPVGNGKEHWTITVNGQTIAHRALPRALPHGTDAVVRSVWLHLNLTKCEPCDALTCSKQPTNAVYGGGYCDEHLHLYST